MESAKEAAACIQENLTFTKFSDSATLLKQDVFAALSSIHEKEADIIFMDPPYEADYHERLLNALKEKNYVTDNPAHLGNVERKKL